MQLRLRINQPIFKYEENKWKLEVEANFILKVKNLLYTMCLIIFMNYTFIYKTKIPFISSIY